MENDTNCSGCGAPMRGFSQCDDYYHICDTCGAVRETCPMCGEELRLENRWGDKDVVCENCGYPEEGPWDDDGPDPNITDTVKLKCPICRSVFLLERVADENLMAEPADEMPGAEQLAEWISAVGPTDLAVYKGRCPKCRCQEIALIDRVDGIVTLANGDVGSLTPAGMIEIIPPPPIS